MTNHTILALSCLSGLAIGCGGTDATVASSDPIGFTFESAAGSLASFGWSGAVHDVVGPAGTPFGVEITACQGEVCQFQGPTDPGGKVNRRRCLFRMSTMCTTDSDCPLDGASPTPCVYIYDAPISQPLVGTDNKIGACAWSYIPISAAGQPPTIAGTLNLTTGALDLEKLTVLLPLNANATGTFRGACGECIGDPTPNDGVREGTCHLASHVGDGSMVSAEPDHTPDKDLPCDVNRSGTIKGFEGNYSMDCSPTVVHSVNPPLAFGGEFKSTGIVISLSDDSPNCSAAGTAAGKCFCGMCPDNVTACLSSAQCGGAPCRNPSEVECKPAGLSDLTSGFQLNQCKSDTTKFAAYSNGCVGDCDWNDDTGVGTCKSKLDGRTVIGCYPSNDSIVVSGRAHRDDHVGTVYQVSTGAASCIAAGKSPQLNSQLGLPGLLFQKRNFQIIPVYAEDKP